MEVIEEKVYIAVSEKVSECKKNVVWSLQNSGGKGVCILHVHQPAQKIPTPMGYFPAERVGEAEVKAYREKERRDMSKIMDQYVELCQKSGVRIEKLYIESSSIETGIVELINQHQIRRLVMGAASDRQHTRSMTELKSKKAMYVRDNAPPSCHIWFVCKGYLIHTRAAATSLGRLSDAENGVQNPTAPPFDTRNTNWSPSPPRSSADTNMSYSPSLSVKEPNLPWSGPMSHPSPENRNSFSDSPTSEIVQERGMRDIYRASMEPSYAEARVAKVPALEGSNSRRVEDSVASLMETQTLHQGSVLESVYHEECRRRREAEDELARVKEQLEFTKKHVLGELRGALEQKSLLENQISNCNVLLKMLGEKLASTINLMHYYDDP